MFESLFSIPFPSGDIERNIPVVGELFYRYSEEGRDKYQEQRRKRELEKFKNL